MHSNDIKEKFIELRADGQTFGKISEQLGVPKSTLHRWADDHADDILRCRRNEWLDLEAQGRWRAEDLLLDLNSDLDRLEEHLRRFPVQRLGFRDTIMLMREKRRERDYLRSLLMGNGRHSQKSTAKRADESKATPSSMERADTLPLPVGEGRGEGQTSSIESSNCHSPVEIASTDLDKTERSHQNGTTQPRNTNDLQQSNSASSHFPPPQDAVANSTELDELEPGDHFTGSTPYNPNECIQSILQKCLETDRLHRERKSTGNFSSMPGS